MESQVSPTFPNVAVIEIIPQFMQRGREIGVSQTLEEFEDLIRAGVDR